MIHTKTLRIWLKELSLLLQPNLKINILLLSQEREHLNRLKLTEQIIGKKRRRKDTFGTKKKKGGFWEDTNSENQFYPRFWSTMDMRIHLKNWKYNMKLRRQKRNIQKWRTMIFYSLFLFFNLSFFNCLIQLCNFSSNFLLLFWNTLIVHQGLIFEFLDFIRFAYLAKNSFEIDRINLVG